MEGNEVVIQIEHVSLQRFPINAFTGLYAPAGARDTNKLVNSVKNLFFMDLANKASPGIFLLVSDCLLATQIRKKSETKLETPGLSLESLRILFSPFFHSS
ncbi:hypothetical protein Y032_0514g2765 [Ancylostoma ceylanicum]|uniref:Uncharacterized protein n=1 Tax=Ancylostoma ceylanicum TaxID=53326 RepID=A0A016WUZ5_9BILA|nr:hypothetical protein Y032_0514g2765 [Ancylostoma ceylanicum]